MCNKKSIKNRAINGSQHTQKNRKREGEVGREKTVTTSYCGQGTVTSSAFNLSKSGYSQSFFCVLRFVSMWVAVLPLAHDKLLRAWLRQSHTEFALHIVVGVVLFRCTIVRFSTVPSFYPFQYHVVSTGVSIFPFHLVNTSAVCSCESPLVFYRKLVRSISVCVWYVAWSITTVVTLRVCAAHHWWCGRFRCMILWLASP